MFIPEDSGSFKPIMQRISDVACWEGHGLGLAVKQCFGSLATRQAGGKPKAAIVAISTEAYL
jgi:hypothetical protein